MQCGRMCVWSFMRGTVVTIASDTDVEPVAEGHRVWGRGRWQKVKAKHPYDHTSNAHVTHPHDRTQSSTSDAELS
jgi:hypothetical protein